eukprot:541287-Amphidinium_carterae.2
MDSGTQDIKVANLSCRKLQGVPNYSQSKCMSSTKEKHCAAEPKTEYVHVWNILTLLQDIARNTTSRKVN